MTDATPPAPAPEPSKPSTPAAAPAVPAPLVLVVVAAALAVAIGVRASRGGGEGVEQLLLKGTQLAGDPAQGVARALPAFLDAYEKAPDDPRTNLALGKALWELGRPDEALAPLRKAHDLLKGEQETDLLLGRCLSALGKGTEARPIFEAALARRPADPTPLRDLAVLDWTLGDLGGSKAHLDAYLGRLQGGVDPRAVILYRQVAEGLGRPLDAIAPLTSLAALTPGDARLRRELQGLLLERDGWEALAAEARATLAQPDPPPAKGAAAAGAPAQPSAEDRAALVRAVDLYLAGRLLSYEHRALQDALGAFERAARLDPRSVWARLGLAVTSGKLGRPDAARGPLEALVKEDPTFQEARFHLAKLDACEGRLEQAQATFDALVQGQGPLGRPSAEWAVGCRLAGPKPEEALTLARSFVRPGAGPGDTSRGLEARTLRRLGRTEEVLKLLEAMRDGAQDAGDRIDSLEHLAHALLEAGRDADAVRSFDAALAALPAGETPPPGMLLWAGVARCRVDLPGARALWERGAAPARPPVGQAVWSCRRLLGQPVEADLLGCARAAEPSDLNDAWYVEGLARSFAGDAEGAKKAWEAARAATWAHDFPERLIARALP